jgi:hypothetical protein
MGLVRTWSPRQVIAALLVPLALNSILLTATIERWSRVCVRPFLVADGTPLESADTCNMGTNWTIRMLSGLTFAELALHLVLAALVAFGISTSAFEHVRTMGAALRILVLLPFATVLPWGGPRVHAQYSLAIVAPDTDPLSWMMAWHMNHRGLFGAVALLHSAAALLWVFPPRPRSSDVQTNPSTTPISAT